MKNLNLMQKRIFLIGVGIIILMGLIPPWSATTQTIHFDSSLAHKPLASHTTESAAGYHFIFLPPRSYGFRGEEYTTTDSSEDYGLDFGRLFIQWIFVAAGAAALIFYFKDWKPKD